MKKRIVLFASGTGSNTINIIQYFNNHPEINVVGVLSNNPKALVLANASKLGVESSSFTKEMFLDTQAGVLETLERLNPDLIVLAGFLWKFPTHLLKRFPLVINIHPSLLPKYGGKGMYGAKVHQAVLENKEAESGITIHMVNEIYDDGAILFQAKTPIDPNEDIESLQQKIHLLEHKHFPVVIEELLTKKHL